MLTQDQAEKIMALGTARAAQLILDGGVWWKSPAPAADGPDVPGSEDWTDTQLQEALTLYAAMVRLGGGIAATVS